MKDGQANPVEILMIDDNPADIDLVRETFREQMKEGVIQAVRAGSEAPESLPRSGPYARAARPDLILLDLNMPGKNGYEVLREIRQDLDLCCIPVVILTSSTAQQDIDRGYRSSANAYLSKPVGLDQFSNLVRTIEAFWLEAARLPSRGCGQND